MRKITIDLLRFPVIPRRPFFVPTPIGFLRRRWFLRVTKTTPRSIGVGGILLRRFRNHLCQNEWVFANKILVQAFGLRVFIFSLLLWSRRVCLGRRDAFLGSLNIRSRGRSNNSHVVHFSLVGFLGHMDWTYFFACASFQKMLASRLARFTNRSDWSGRTRACSTN